MSVVSTRNSILRQENVDAGTFVPTPRPSVLAPALPGDLPRMPQLPRALGSEAKLFAAQLEATAPDLVAAPVPESFLVRVARRTIDVAVSLAALLVLWPLILLSALIVRLDSPGPGFFRQKRLGRLGSPFEILKLRGMHVDAAVRFPHLYDYTDESRATQFHLPQDPRVTRAGKLFRRTSIDELPNFWNVLRGDMSLVGPRPQIPEMFEYYGEYAQVILSVRPGIFSLPKVCLRDHLTLHETVLLDSYYVHNRTLLLDLRIALRGIAIVLLRHGVH